jgi:hypothetical protein
MAQVIPEFARLEIPRLWIPKMGTIWLFNSWLWNRWPIETDEFPTERSLHLFWGCSWIFHSYVKPDGRSNHQFFGFDHPVVSNLVIHINFCTLILVGIRGALLSP